MVAPISFIKPSNRLLDRPGVTHAFLKAAGVERVSASEAEVLCGLREPGIWLPFRTVGGKPVSRDSDTGKSFGRLRLTTSTRDGKKYHQRVGSKPYAYLPHNLQDLAGQSDLILVEGEFKAMALAEAGFAAVGICGINLAFSEGQLVPGLREVVQTMAPGRVLWLGDSDTSLILDFSREAVKLAKALHGIEVSLPRIGLDGPGKGIDDCRAAVGNEAFSAYWAELVEKAEPVSPDDSSEDVAVRLLVREKPEAIRRAV